MWFQVPPVLIPWWTDRVRRRRTRVAAGQGAGTVWSCLLKRQKKLSFVPRFASPRTSYLVESVGAGDLVDEVRCQQRVLRRRIEFHQRLRHRVDPAGRNDVIRERVAVGGIGDGHGRSAQREQLAEIAVAHPMVVGKVLVLVLLTRILVPS